MKQKVILTIEDDPDFRLNVVTTLEHEGYRVYSAENGDEGLKILNEIQMPCLILLDYFMPLVNGEQFFKKIKTLSKYRHIPIVLLTATSAKPHLPEEVKILRKPVEIEDLLNVVKEYCHCENTKQELR